MTYVSFFAQKLLHSYPIKNQRAAVLHWCYICSQQNLHGNKINVHSIFMFVIMVTQLSLNLLDFSKRCEEFSMLK